MADDGKGTTTRIGGFELLERLGQGGMGTVYRARQVSMDRVVALKILPPKLAKDKSFVERFIREARAAASLQHPNIVQGIDVGVADGYYYFAMELVDGPTVRQVIQREGKLDEQRALGIVRGMALALGHAHERGIIHRDIKPDNIMLTAKGEPKLADLGLARSIEKPTSVTIEGTALGTPYYMAPEQIRGLPDIDTRADIYALGATLFHMVTGQYPFDGPSASAIMTRHVTDPPPSARAINADVSRACDELIQRMMAKDPADRPQTPAELLSDIDDALAGRVHLRPGPRTKTRALAGAPKHRKARPSPGDVGGASLPVGGASLPRVRRSNTLGWAFAGIGILVLAIVLIVLATRGGGPKPPPTDAGQLALQQADAYAKQHPSDCDGAIARYQAVASQHGGTQWAAIATGRVEELRKAKAAASVATKASRELQAAIAKLQADARDLAGKDRFGDALKAIADFAGKHKEPDAADAADKLKTEIEQRARQRYDELAAAADAALAAKDHAKAREALTPIEGFGIPPLADEAKAKLAEIDAAEKNAEHLAKWDGIKTQAAKLAEEGKFDDALKLLDTAKAIPLDDMADRVADEVAAVEDARRDALDKVLAAYAAESEKVWAAFKERDYAAADRLLAELAKKPELQPAADALAADQQAAGLLKAFWAAVEEGLRLRVGQFLAFGGEGGTIAAVKDGQVTLNTPKGEATLPLVKLSAKQALLYVLLKDDARSHLTKGVFLLAEQAELDEAQQALASAGDAPHVAVYRDRLDALRLGATEAAARRAWEQIQSYAKGKLTESRAARLRTLLDAFTAQHGNTKLAASIEADLATLRDRLRDAGEGWLSLFDGETLRGWRVVDDAAFAGHGKIAVKDGSIVVESGEKRAAITWTRGFPKTDYEVTVNVTRLAGRDSIVFVFPVGAARSSLLLSPDTVGLHFVHGGHGKTNATARKFRNENGRWYSLSLKVTQGRIALSAEGEPLIDFAVQGHRVAPWPGAAAIDPFGVYTVDATAALRSIRLRRLAPEAEPRGEAPEAGAWQSLFDGKSLRGWRKSTRGKFARPGAVLVEGGVLVVGGGRPWTAVACTQKLPTLDYELELEARRVNGLEDFCDMLFPVGAGYGRLMAGGDGGGRLAVSVKTPVAEGEGTVRTWHRFHSDRWYRLRLRVSRARFEVFVDDQRLLDAPTASIGVELKDGYEDLVPLGIFTWNTRSHVRNIRLRRLP